VSVSDVGHVPHFIRCLVWLWGVVNGEHMWCVVGNRLRPGARGAVLLRQRGCSSLLFGLLFLPLLDQLVF